MGVAWHSRLGFGTLDQIRRADQRRIENPSIDRALPIRHQKVRWGDDFRPSQRPPDNDRPRPNHAESILRSARFLFRQRQVTLAMAHDPHWGYELMFSGVN